MEYAYSLSAAAPTVRKYKIDGGTTVIAGVPVCSDSATADSEGIVVCTTTAAVACMGLSLDTATSTDAQATSGDNAGDLSVIINPDACYRAKFTEGATEDTALTLITQTTANAAGTTVGPTTTDEFNVWGYEGANAGKDRRCTAANTVVHAMPYGIAAGDTFLEAGVWIGARDHFPQLSTLLTQYNANAAADTDNDNFIVVETQLRDISEDGRNNSFAIMLAAHHVFSGCHTAGT
ncbi:MAG: hypothetical protein ACYSWU_20945 [Planctomycetota bacterium]|jgi:hypothetical protein